MWAQVTYRMWAQVTYRIGDSMTIEIPTNSMFQKEGQVPLEMTIEIPTNSMFQKEGQVPLDVLSVDLPLFHSQATPTAVYFVGSDDLAGAATVIMLLPA